MATIDDSNRLKLQIPNEIKEKVIELKNELLKFENVSKVYLYGSYAKGTYKKDSDIDIAVFVVDGNDNRNSYMQFNRLARSSKYDIQIQVFSEKELAEPNGIIDEVVRFGKDITLVMG